MTSTLWIMVVLIFMSSLVIADDECAAVVSSNDGDFLLSSNLCPFACRGSRCHVNGEVVTINTAN